MMNKFYLPELSSQHNVDVNLQYLFADNRDSRIHGAVLLSFKVINYLLNIHHKMNKKIQCFYQV